MTAVSKEMLERMRKALAFDSECSPPLSNLISIKRGALEALIATAEGVVAYEEWAKAHIAKCHEAVHFKKEPSIVVNHLVDEARARNRSDRLLELRVLNFSLRILSGETPEYGCRECTQSDTCFDGSVACQKQATK